MGLLRLVSSLALRAGLTDAPRAPPWLWSFFSPQRGLVMAEAAKPLSLVPEAEIDPDGTFKYILLRVQGSGDEYRDIVRGTSAAEFHNHIFEKVNPEIEKLGFVCKCLGGGKIEHNSKDKKMRVFGLSTGYGKADHSVTVEILKRRYKDYEISWSDDKK
ncbi:14 kDa phosphohistidine phosphatase-like [Hemicordylus capensis]|uniref:14 kDa phosphohistidine phosphatase-like n=1 Tax=Hemicordylus capensis TaxID=884348 RepID=UPI0023037DFE|nr:14 kDa phosphohistidine phosphatase-like [Hemicordylus capensis]